MLRVLGYFWIQTPPIAKICQKWTPWGAGWGANRVLGFTIYVLGLRTAGGVLSQAGPKGNPAQFLIKRLFFGVNGYFSGASLKIIPISPRL